MVFEVPCFESGMVVKKNLIFSPYKKSQFMPQVVEFESPCKSSTFDDEDSINRDREETSEMEGFSPAYGGFLSSNRKGSHLVKQPGAVHKFECFQLIRVESEAGSDAGDR
jgi:hypothetical protein